MSLDTLPDTTIDNHDYPTEPFLEWLKNERDPKTALEQAASYFTECGYGRAWHEDGNLNLATGGWSGCEDVIEALGVNLFVWPRTWLSSHRGGKYVFEWDGPEVGK